MGVFGAAAAPALALNTLASVRQLKIAPGAAELAADVDPAPVGEVLGVRHDDAWNPVGRGICRSERQRDRRRCQPQ